MKKRVTAALCGLLALCTALSIILSAAAAQDEMLYFMAVNDVILDLEDETMPRMVSGVLYVPYIMFDRNSTKGVSLGVFSQYSRSKSTMMIYGWEGTLIFDLNNGTATFNDENCGGKALIRNSMVFVPLDLVCELFGLEWSWIVMDRGNVIRVKNEDVVLPDRDFANAATYAVEGRYQKYLQNKNAAQQPEVSEPPASPSPTVSPSPEVTPTTPVTPVTPVTPGDVLEAEDARICLGFRMEEGEGFRELLKQLAESGTYGVFFCKPEELSARDDDVRTLLAAGHRIGLLLDADTVEGQLEQMERGNGLLSRIAHTETAVCISEGLTRAERAELEAQVCLWQTSLDGTAKGRAQARQISAVVSGVAPERRYFVLMDDSRQSVRALESIFSQLTEEGAAFYLATEVTLQD